MFSFRQWRAGVLGWVFARVAHFASGVDVTLEWNASADTNTVGYLLYCGAEQGKYSHVVNTETATSATIPGLLNGQTYFFAVTSYDDNGREGAFSNEAVLTTPDVSGAGSFETVSGNYTALFQTSRPSGSGRLAGVVTLRVGARGAYSGRMQASGMLYGFVGKLDALGLAVLSVGPRNAPVMNLRLQVGLGPNLGNLVGLVSVGGEAKAALSGERSVSIAGSGSAPALGTYTFVLPGQTDNPSLPAGHGYGTLRVSSGGKIRFAGCLGDGTKFTSSATASQTGRWPFYAFPYSGRGFLLGWPQFIARPGDDLNGSLTWSRPTSPRQQYYPGGFDTTCEVIGSVYSPKSPPITLVNPEAKVAGGEIAEGFTVPLAVKSDGSLYAPRDAGFRLTLSRTTGTFRGSLTSPPNGRRWFHNGVAFQKHNAAYGLLMGKGQTSQLTVTSD